MCVNEKDLTNVDYLEQCQIKIIRRDIPFNKKVADFTLAMLDNDDIIGEHLDAEQRDTLERLLYEAENAISGTII